VDLLEPIVVPWIRDEDEERVWEAHEDKLARMFNLHDVKVNYGWSVDTIEGTITSKVYGHGYLTTNSKLEHYWEDM
jgi:hypothetical protein